MSAVAVDISVILTLKQDGMLAHNSLVSAARARARAEGHGLGVEILVVADRPDPITAHYLDTARTLGATVQAGEFGCEARARAAGVAAAHGRHVALLRGDCIWSTDWLVAAHNRIQRSAPNVILHPEATLLFGSGIEPSWIMHHDADTAQGEWTNLALHDPWTPSSFTRHEIHLKLSQTGLPAGVDGEASIWAWHCETIRFGCSHKSVPGTTHALRHDRVDRGRQQIAPATGLFRDRFARA